MSETPDTPGSATLFRRRSAFLAPIWLLALAGIVVIAAAFAYWNSANTTTVVVIRHADKAPNAIADAPLSPPGEQRAVRLAQMFGDAEKFGRVKKLYVTETRRAQQTVAELAERLGVKPEVVDSQASPAQLARRVLRENRGGLALVVGHSNTVPEIVGSLAGVENVPRMGEEEFDTMYIVTVPTIGRASVLRLKY